MEFIASPAGVFGLLAASMLSSYIGGNLKNDKPLPQSEISIWIWCSIVGIILLFLTNGQVPLPPQGFGIIILLTVCSLCSATVLVYTSFN